MTTGGLKVQGTYLSVGGLNTVMPTSLHPNAAYAQIGSDASIFFSDTTAAYHLGQGAHFMYNAFLGDQGHFNYRSASKSASRLTLADGSISLQLSRECETSADGDFGKDEV